ncbi:MAG TPA: type II toxin-antitoxin system VapC family toxin [Acidobacteriota bacterium]|nr:type II toxin-antitoxin system VapC family toxin [Acidobacteriota bacterium]
MKILLDTCTFLWWIADAPQISERARELARSPENEVYLSVVSAWEIAVNHNLGRLPLPQRPQRFVPAMRRAHGFKSLPLEEESVFHLNRLPDRHADPFDRMLICQAISGGMVLLTPDEHITRYPVRCDW